MAVVNPAPTPKNHTELLDKIHFADPRESKALSTSPGWLAPTARNVNHTQGHLSLHADHRGLVGQARNQLLGAADSAVSVPDRNQRGLTGQYITSPTVGNFNGNIGRCDRQATRFVERIFHWIVDEELNKMNRGFDASSYTFRSSRSILIPGERNLSTPCPSAISILSGGAMTSIGSFGLQCVPA